MQKETASTSIPECIDKRENQSKQIEVKPIRTWNEFIGKHENQREHFLFFR